MKSLTIFPLLVLLSLPAIAQRAPLLIDDDELEIAPWVEGDYTLPPFPKDEDLVEFDVDGAPNVRAYVDRTAIGAGTPDMVVRYVLVVRTSGGANNVSYEGLRCDTNEYRLYATGTQEQTWAKARSSEWRRFRIHNRVQRSLANYYFCPNSSPVLSVREALDALRAGIHPAAARRNHL